MVTTPTAKKNKREKLFAKLINERVYGKRVETAQSRERKTLRKFIFIRVYKCDGIRVVKKRVGDLKIVG